jgi:serine protease
MRKISLVITLRKLPAIVLMQAIFISFSFAQNTEVRIRFRSAGTVLKQPVNGKEDLLSFTPSLQKLQQRFGLSKLKGSFFFSKAERFRRTYRLRFSNKKDLVVLLKELNALPEVEWAEEIPVDKLDWVANDMGVNTTSGQWALHKIEAQAAWDIHRGSTSVVVAVVDCGVDLNHPDLQNKLVAGRDVSDDDSNPDIPNNTFDHGTHVAGIVGAETNNSVGVASIGNRIRIMPIKAQEDDGDADQIADGYEGILWAAEHGADIINCSWGGYTYSSSNQDVINEANNVYGALVIAAAGNDNSFTKHYPAAYIHVIAVASTTFDDLRSSFSNYGDWVDICAPGSSIRSTVPGGSGYANKNGTSMACPMVAGVCGLIKSCSGSYTPSQITNMVKNAANPIINANQPNYNGLLGTGRLDAYQALSAASVCRNNETITGNFTRALTESSNWIHSSGTCTIAANEQVILDAATEIILNPGFNAVSGTMFRADIEGCGDGPPDGATRQLPKQPAKKISDDNQQAILSQNKPWQKQN